MRNIYTVGVWLCIIGFFSECVGCSSSLPVVGFDCADLLSHCLKHLLNTSSFFCRHLWPYHFVFLSECNGALLVNPLLLYRDITLISSECHNKSILVRRRVRLHFVNPVLDRFKRRFIRQVVADNCTNGISIVHVDHWSEAFMTTCIPNVHLHLLLSAGWILWILHAYYFLEVGAADRDIVHLVKLVLAEAKCDRWLTDCRIS